MGINIHKAIGYAVPWVPTICKVVAEYMGQDPTKLEPVIAAWWG